MNQLDRRHFLALMGLGAVAVAAGGSLAACGKEAGSTGNATNTDALGALMPKYTPMDLVKPDIVGTPPVANGFLKYPTTLVDAITTKPGGSGRKATAMTPWWGPTPPGLGSNAYYDAVNADLGIPVDFSVQDGNTYADKLNAMLGARDVPDLLCIPGWEIVKIPRFADAVHALFEDLTPFLAGGEVAPYKMLSAFPPNAWRNAVWDGKLAAIPWPTDGPFPWFLFYRKDLLDKLGQAYPKSLDEILSVGRAVTDAGKGVWAYSDIFPLVQMYHKVPGSRDGWTRTPSGQAVFKYELPEYKAAVEFASKLYTQGLVHPDIVASKGADVKTLFSGGKILFMQDGPGAWQGLQTEQSKVTPGFNMQPVPFMSATGGTPAVWGSDLPIFYTFIKKGLGADRVKELLRVLDWCAAPFGTKEWELREYGKEGTHFTRDAGGAPVGNQLAAKEIAFQYGFLVGRVPAFVSKPETPNYVKDLLTFSNDAVKYLEKDPWEGIKLEMPANFSKVLIPTEDRITDVIRGRRPLSDLSGIVSEWKSGGGAEATDFMSKALADNGR